MAKGFKKKNEKGGHDFIPTDKKPHKGHSSNSPGNNDGSTGLTRGELDEVRVKEKIGSISEKIRDDAEKHVGSEITGNPYGNMYEFENGEEYLIFDNEEDAHAEAMESLENLYDDLGVSAWSDGFADNFMEMSETDIRLWANEDGDRYVEGRDEDEIIDMANDFDIDVPEHEDGLTEKQLDDLREKVSEKRSDYVEDLLREKGLKYYICDEEGLCSNDEFWEQYGKWLYVDKDAMFRESIRVDGIAHTLATYDGDEIELPGGALMYRVN